MMVMIASVKMQNKDMDDKSTFLPLLIFFIQTGNVPPGDFPFEELPGSTPVIAGDHIYHYHDFDYDKSILQ